MSRGSGTRYQVLLYVERYYRRWGYGPTVREIREGTGLASLSTVAYHVDALCDDGMLVKWGPRHIITPAPVAVEMASVVVEI